MEARRKNQIVLLVLSSLLCASGAAAEKVQIRGSTSIEVPKPKHSLEELRNLKVPGGPSGQDEYQGGISASAPVYTTTPEANKKLKELLDKKKNWIFMNPYESNYDSKTEEFLKGEKGTGLYDHPLMKGDDESLMEKYLNEGNPEREEGNEMPDPGSKEFREARQEMRAERNELAQERNVSPLVAERNVQSPFSPQPSTPSLFNERGLFDRDTETRFRETGISSGLDRPVSGEEIRKERDARDAEIVRMLQPRSTAPGAAGSFSPIGRPLDFTRQESTPNVIGSLGSIGTPGAQRNPGTVDFGRSEPAAIGTGIRNGPIFSGSAPISSPARSGFDFGSRPGVSSAPATLAPSAPSAITAPARSVTQKPFVLPFPKRQF